MKKMMKKLTLGFLALFGLGVVVLGVGGIGSTASAQSNNGKFWAQSTNAGKFWINNEQTSGLATAGAGDDKKWGLIDVFKSAINWVLSILSLITLAVLLWGGFQMVTAAGDDGKYKKGFTILKQAGIGLAFIGLSWFVVTIIFWLIWWVTGTAS